MEQDVLTFHQARLGYGERTILQDVSLSVQRGQVVSIMGGSGSGKTTLLRAATGQIAPLAGEVCLLGQRLEQQTQLSALRQRIGVLFQHGALFTDLDVFENVAFPLRELRRLSEQEITSRVLNKLEQVGLRAAAHLKLTEISGGMARRVALARAIILDPEVIFFDEPFAGLDPITLNVTAKLIRHLTDSLHCASVLITHDIEESFAISDQVHIVGQGRILASGTVEDIRQSNNPHVQQFLSATADLAAFNYPVTPAFEHWLSRKRGH